jgi:hypothetical protein
MLGDPRAAHDEHNSFLHCLVGLAGLARMVHALAGDEHRREVTSTVADDFVHLLLGLGSIGETVGLLARTAPNPRLPADPSSSGTTPSELLR